MRNNFVGVFFIALFYSLLAVFQCAATTDWSIHDWNGTISWATAENLDIGRRIASFYRSFGIFFIAFFFLLFILSRFLSPQRHSGTENSSLRVSASPWSKGLFFENELSILNYLSLAGCMLLFFKLIGAEVSESLMLIFVMQLLVLIYALADFFLNGFARKQSLPLHELAWCGIVGVCAFFVLNYFFLNSGYNAARHYNKWLFVLSAVPLHFCFWLRRRGNNNSLCKRIISFRYIALIPALIVLAQEKYMILNQHNIFSIHPTVIFLLLLLIAILLIVRSSRKVRSLAEAEAPAITAISNFYFPWLVVGLIAFTYYRPVVEAPTEMFEQANPALSIQQYYEFGKLPWLQTFSSHSGADFLTGFLYSMFNGFTGLSYHCYDFLVIAIYVLLLYYTIRNLTGNPYLAFLSVLLYPYMNLLIPQYHNFMLIPLLILAATLNAPSSKNYFFFFSSLILMPLWRYDLGYGNIVALLASMFIFMLLKKELRSSFPAMRKGFLYAWVLPIILFVIALAKSKQSIFINIKDALGYLNSAQAFGIKDLAAEKNLVYFVHYFIFPCAVAVCFFFALYRLVRSAPQPPKGGNAKAVTAEFLNPPLGGTEAAPFSIVAVIFLSIYYFANFHRGLIRHNLAEGWDTAFTSFGFFIVTVTTYDFLRTKNKVLQLATVCAFASLLLVEFKYAPPEFSKNNYYSELSASIHAPALAMISNEKIDRAPVKPEFAKETFNDLKGFLDKNISPDATFLDFSNTPMLYLYTHRQLPNYFNQIPHTAVNTYLQQRFIEELKNYKIPVVLFSNSPAQWWDSFDGVPNTYRHYLIGEYIYEHYQPYAVIDHHSVWVEKGNKLLLENHPEYIKDTLSDQPKDQQLKFLPYVMGMSWPVVPNDSVTLFKKAFTTPSSIDAKNGGEYTFSETVRNNEANYVLIKVKNFSGKREDLHFSFGNNDHVNGGFSFYLKEDNEEHAYLIRLSTQYNWYKKENSLFDFKMSEGKCQLTEFDLMKGKQ